MWVPSLELLSAAWRFWRQLVSEFGYSSADVRPGRGLLRIIQATPNILPSPPTPSTEWGPHNCDST